jgi:hypothetical protein
MKKNIFQEAKEAMSNLFNDTRVKDRDEALALIKRSWWSDSLIDETMSQISPDLRKDRDFMLQAIDVSSQAYLHAHKSINNFDFRLNAIQKNAMVYTKFSDEHRN